MKFLDVPQSGSIAGTTHSHNRAGQYTRNRRAPVQPVGTGRRAFIRSAFGAASTAWSGLSSSVQAGWTTFADSHPITDSLGQSIKLTGHQMYVGVYTQCINTGNLPPVAIPASTVTRAPGVTVYSAVGSTGVITLTLDGGGDPADWFLVAFARPQPSGRSQVTAYWQAQVEPGDSTTLVGLGALVVAQFGPLVAGMRLFIRITPVNADFWTGTPIKQFCTVT